MAYTSNRVRKWDASGLSQMLCISSWDVRAAMEYAKFMANPGKVHCEEVTRGLRFLQHVKEMGLLFECCSPGGAYTLTLPVTLILLARMLAS